MLLRDLTGEAFSAFGVSKESGGIHVFALADAATAPLRQNDLIQAVNSDPVRTIAELIHRLASLTPGASVTIDGVRDQSPLHIKIPAPVSLPTPGEAIQTGE
jgi:S1-C subfamily serine protease